jgi:hypothetical protein
MQDGNLGDAQDESDKTDNQQPETALDSQHHAHNQNCRHQQVNKKCQKDIHQVGKLPSAPRQASLKKTEVYAGSKRFTREAMFASFLL